MRNLKVSALTLVCGVVAPDGNPIFNSSRPSESSGFQFAGSANKPCSYIGSFYHEFELVVCTARKTQLKTGYADTTLPDSGYFSVDNIGQEGKGVELLIASGREGKEDTVPDKGVYSIERFEYIKESDSWKCPGSRQVVREKKTVSKGRPKLRRYVCADCGGCPLMVHCLKPGEERRTLLVKKKQLIRAEMRARLKRPEKQAIYRKRKWVAEQVFGQIKESLGFRGVTERGREYARAQWLFACAVHNVMKAVRYIQGGRKDAIPQGTMALVMS